MTRKLSSYIILPALVMVLGSCTPDENSPGLEYMPDMYRSPAIEAYVDYGQDPYDFSEEIARSQRDSISARRPAMGTIPYGSEEDMMYKMPYPHPNTPEGYEASASLVSPIEFNQESVDAGKEIYDIMCTHCHGAKGAGDGAISANGHITGIPAYDGNLKDLPEGKMYHSLTHGIRLMPSAASQLTPKERWTVIQYVKYLQNGGSLGDEGAEDTTETATEEAAEIASEETAGEEG